MASIAHDFLPAEAAMPTDRQRLFALFFTGTLIDLVILGLFAEYSDKVYVDTFTTTLLAAIGLAGLAVGPDGDIYVSSQISNPFAPGHGNSILRIDPRTDALLKIFNDTLWNDLDNAGILDMASKSFYPLQQPAVPGDVKLDAWANPPANTARGMRCGCARMADKAMVEPNDEANT